MAQVTQIEYYDKDVLKNILGVLSIRPDRVVYFYDDAIRDKSVFDDLAKCLRRHLPKLLIDTVPVDILSMQDIYSKTRFAIRQSEKCIMELTGGSELMLLAGFKAGAECGAELVYTDINRRKIFPLGVNGAERDLVGLSLEDFLDAKGASFMGTSQVEPRPADYDKILAMCRTLFRSLKEWKATCGYVQFGMGGAPTGDLRFSCNTEIIDKTGRFTTPSMDLLRAFERFGFIHHLRQTKNKTRFEFNDHTARRYMMTFGVWLELWVFIHAKLSGAFDDVRLGAMIDWDAGDRKAVVGNEIDVLLSMDSMPVFISCKLREVGTADINELVIAKKRLGGWFSKGLLVSFGVAKSTNNGTYQRGLDLGVEMMDKTDILSKDFGDRLLRVIHDYDLVKMKWEKL